jgi:hypothetical protein
MQRILAKAAALILVAPAILIGSADSASAADCAVLKRTYTEGSSKYAVVRNTCARRITARAVVNNFPDTNCLRIAAKGQRTFRTGGSFSPSAHGAVEC